MASEIVSKPAPSGVQPVCPSCKKDLDFAWERPTEVKSTVLFARIGPRVLMCPHCRVWLGQIA